MKNIGGETELMWCNQLGGEKFCGEIYSVVKNTVVKNSLVKNFGGEIYSVVKIFGGEISSVVKDSVVKCTTPYVQTLRSEDPPDMDKYFRIHFEIVHFKDLCLIEGYTFSFCHFQYYLETSWG